MKKLYCPECGNYVAFSVSAVEHHTWHIDNLKNFVYESETGDAKMGDDYQCRACGAYVSEVEFCDDCGLLEVDGKCPQCADTTTEGEKAETIVHLANGNTIRSNSETLMAGDYVRICDPNGKEVGYWDHMEWVEEPILVMGAILRMAENL
jgi:hypothetical protein